MSIIWKKNEGKLNIISKEYKCFKIKIDEV